MCLYNAILAVSKRERGRYPVYSGLNGVKLDTKVVSNGFFVTYVSTSWKKEVSEKFIGVKKGMIIHFDVEYRDCGSDVPCCDVSWISKFPDECEVLFARPIDYYKQTTNFSCIVLDEQTWDTNCIIDKRMKHL